MSLGFNVVSVQSDPFVTLECAECGAHLDSAEAEEHSSLHQAAAEAERSGGLTGLVAWLLAVPGGAS